MKCIYCHVLAVGSFSSSTLRSAVSFIPLRFIHYTILHSISPQFISPTSAPHSISGSFNPLHLSMLFHSASRPDTLSQCYCIIRAVLLHSCQHTRYTSFSRHPCFKPSHNKSGMLYFFLRHITPIERQNPSP